MRSMIAMLGIVLLTLGARLASTSISPATHQAQKGAVCTLKVTGMTCGGCAAAVKAAAKKVDGVKDAKVSHERSRAEITYDPAKTTPEAIAKAITEKSGFKAEVQAQKQAPKQE